MSNLGKVIITAAFLLGSGSLGYAQGTPSPEELTRQAVLNCLEQADSHYKSEWRKHCPGGLNGPICEHPRSVADPLNSDYDRTRNFCLQAKGAGLLH
jgi:hypothetical protein